MTEGIVLWKPVRAENEGLPGGLALVEHQTVFKFPGQGYMFMGRVIRGPCREDWRAP